MSTEAKPVPLFDSLRVDPKKVAEGVWIQHPETKDRFLARRLWCPEHSRAWLQAAEDYDRKHGEGESDTPDGLREVDAVALATGVVIDWQIHKQPDLKYDPTLMAAALMDPGLAELRTWLGVQVGHRRNFRPDDIAGN